MPPEHTQEQWRFWIDRGGTFTDIVARKPDGSLVTHKLLSESPEQYKDAAVQGIREVLGLASDTSLPCGAVAAVKMGTTVATNALLERKGVRTLFVTTEGFGDVLRIGNQTRPRLFDRHIVLPEMLYERVVEVSERISARGEVIAPLEEEAARQALQAAFDDGIRAVAIAFMHGYRYPDHENRIAAMAEEIGFTQVSASHSVSPLMKLVSRGDTTVVDAYLSPILRRYVDQVAGQLEVGAQNGPRLMFMQSNGGLTDARLFQGKDAILSGPAGGVVGMVRTAAMGGFEKLIGFDMGGTSTDVSHYDGEFERTFESQVAGVRLRAPMMHIHTVAAGGGSILHFDGARYRVGPDSAGADPGPACYRRGGPLTVTDCNVILGKIQPAHFPEVFGPKADEALDSEVLREKFAALTEEIVRATGKSQQSPEMVAEGFLRIAVENMANAIKKISVQRGYDVTEYTLNCFGGAGGQHACLVADALGMTKVFLHPFAGVLSAYGMGLAEVRAIRERQIEAAFAQPVILEIESAFAELAEHARGEVLVQGVEPARVNLVHKVQLRYEGTDSPLQIDYADLPDMKANFEAAHKKRFGFTVPGRSLVVESVSVEAVGSTDVVVDPEREAAGDAQLATPLTRVAMHTQGESHDTPLYDRNALLPGQAVDGPALITETTGTTVVEPGWRAEMTSRGHLVLTRVVARPKTEAIGTEADPVMLEVFNNLFMSIAEQMGVTLANTAYSVTIKERWDFSCAIFDPEGNLVANAPHIPVHLGSMSESVRTVIKENRGRLAPGDVYVLNAPYNGGTHLPDITVITPVFDTDNGNILFYVGSRGHHADIGGTTPGSMPPDSRTVEEEGVLIDNFKLVENGRFHEEKIRAVLRSGRFPARNPEQNIADLRAQVAANEKGVQELTKIIGHFGLEVVQAYMHHVQDNAEEQVRRVIDRLSDGHFSYAMDDGSRIEATITVDRASRSAKIDFTGTSPQQSSNFNAPSAVCRAVVLYVFRALVDDEIPMNEGCLKPLEILIPEGCMLRPAYPAAVVAGNVETSQAIADCIFGAIGALAGAQGTMNNLTFGNDKHQYYETIAGGSGAGPGFDGADAVQTHMTNSRLTDPEVLEWRLPVRLEAFRIRLGSGGAGQHRGGDGVSRSLRFLEDVTVSILSNHRKVPNFGLAGGKPGALGHNWIERADGQHEELGGTGSAQLHAGDRFVIETPGGGGYGQRKLD